MITEQDVSHVFHGSFELQLVNLQYIVLKPDCMCQFLFELMLYIPVNSNGHVGMLPPFYGTFTQHLDVMTLKMCFFQYNNPTKPIRLICMDGLTRPPFLGRLIHEWLTSNQMACQ